MTTKRPDGLPAIRHPSFNRINPLALHTFLPLDVLYHHLLPFFPFRLPNHGDVVKPKPPSGIPLWTKKLEAWYRHYHHSAFDILAADDEQDRQYYAEMAPRIQQNIALADRSGPEGAAWLQQIRDDVMFVWGRRVVRWLRLYSLHAVREMYIKRKGRVVFADLPGELPDSLLLRLREDDVWPLPTDAPTNLACFGPHLPTIIIPPQLNVPLPGFETRTSMLNFRVSKLLQHYFCPRPSDYYIPAEPTEESQAAFEAFDRRCPPGEPCVEGTVSVYAPLAWGISV